MILNESGIRIPKGTKAAKIIFHQDLDGIFSAILAMKQLEKQGIPKNRIKLSSIQYGMNNEKVKKMLQKRKGQMVVLVDFARISDDVDKPDFWSDHHINEAIEVPAIAAPHALRSLLRRHAVPEEEVDNLYEKLIKLPLTGKKEEDLKLISKVVEDKGGFSLGAAMRGSGYKYLLKIAASTPENKKMSQREFYNLEKKRKQSKHSKSGASIGRTEFPSEASHLAQVHAKGLIDSSSLKAINAIDSATFKNLEDVFLLKKDFKKKGRMERLGNILNALVSQLIKTNPEAIEYIIRNSNPSIMSVYMNTLRALKLHNVQKEILDEIAKEKPDWNKIDLLRSKLPMSFAKKTGKGTELKNVSDYEKSVEKVKSDIEKSTNIKTTKFRKGSEAVIIHDAAGRGAAGRYMGAMLTKPDGTRYPAYMREWSNMLQVALNPDLEKQYKDKVDLTKLMKEAITDTKKEMGKKWSNWSFQIVFGESGGHKGIATLSGLGTIGFLPKLKKKEYYDLKDLDKRIRALKSKRKMKEMMPEKAKKLKELEDLKEKLALQRKQIKAEIKKKLIQKITEALKDIKVKPLKNAERFKAKKMTVKESIKWRSDHLII